MHYNENHSHESHKDRNDELGHDESLSLLRRCNRAYYRATHRGTRELDVIMSRALDRQEWHHQEAVETLEEIVDLADSMLIGWLVHLNPVPAGKDSGLSFRAAEMLKSWQVRKIQQ